MKIITSHERTDMDALSSIYAASLLFPEHQPLLPHNLNRDLREFLALYRDALPFVTRQELPARHIAELLLVDTPTIAPMRGMDACTVIRVIDHHPVPAKPAPNAIYESDRVGATTTLLMERIHARGMTLTRLGASLMLMGIYEDTGSLSYLTTTARDVQAAAWLVEAGADLGLVGEFLNRPLSNGQRVALDELVKHTSIHHVRERTVSISTIELDHNVDELSALAHQLMDTFEPEACFVLAQFGHSTQIIARSATDAIDVGRLMSGFGGGGHSKAGAARLDDADWREVSVALLDALEAQVEPPVLVRELMSTNVHVLRRDMTVRDAATLMRRYGHEGFPVVENERLLGILTRSDIDRALHHRLGDTPVSGYLHTGPLYVRPGDTVDRVQEVMIEYGLGQVPVVDGGRFVGIVTRTDLIKLWSAPARPSRATEIRHLMEESLPEELQRLLIEARDAANNLGYSLYIVGGFVRDLLLGKPNLDLDLVVEGDAMRLARQLAECLGYRYNSHARFGTAKVIIDGERPEGVPPYLDFVTARTEFYERPTVLPQVERSSIKQDLYRRDFTINTLAICLDRDRYGALLDFYGGERDLGEKRIRVLHNLSFVEDPTRILRAVRFEVRLGFAIEQRTAELIDDAIELLDHVTGQRLRNEFFAILCEPEPERYLERLAALGVLRQLHLNLTFTRGVATLFGRLRERFAELAPTEGEDQEAADDGVPSLHLCYLALLTSHLSASDLEELATRLRLTNSDAEFMQDVLQLREIMPRLAATAMLPSAIHRLLRPYTREARFVLSVLTDQPMVRQRMDLYERELEAIEPRITGHDLRAMGVPPGPIYRQILDRVRDALLDKQVTTEAEERALAQQLAMATHSTTHG